MADMPKVRIVSAVAAEAEAEINRLCGDYAPVVWNIGPMDGAIIVTCVLVLESELAKARAAATPAVNMPLNLAALRGLK